MLPKNWPEKFLYSPDSICRDIHPHLLQSYLAVKKEMSGKGGEKKVHPHLEIQKITPELEYAGTSPHPLAGQDVFEGHAQHGVFAKKKIGQGISLGEYAGEVFLSKKNMDPYVVKRGGIYCWHLMINDLWIYIYSGNVANELNFVNDYHGLSESPNVKGKWLQCGGFYYFGYETLREIEPMEEILIDYKSK
jgi:hypothetical protein